jgi:hypothetical protein
MTRPSTVAPSLIGLSPSSPDLVSAVALALAAICRAELIWAEVSGCGAWMNQPSSEVCSWYRRIAWLVMTVLGADVPGGSAAAWTIFGLSAMLGWPAGSPGCRR